MKSKYQKKQQLKGGKGRIDPRWQWWYERHPTSDRVTTLEALATENPAVDEQEGE